jgi:hypothetical protein
VTDLTPSLSGDERFAWHPTYRGRTAREVRDELRVEIDRDQRQYALSMEGAEEHEQRVLASVIELERRWSGYDFGWLEVDPGELADRIVAFEWERERRQTLIPFEEYRRSLEPALAPPAAPEKPWWAFWRR